MVYVAPDRQLLLSRDISGNPFAFIPSMCRVYSLTDSDIAGIDFPDGDDDYALVELSTIKELEDEYFDFFRGSDYTKHLRNHPPGIALIVTQSCNLACSYCLAKQGTFGLEVFKMDIDQVLGRITSLFSAYPDISFIKFFGGEPTLRMDIIESVCEHVQQQLKKSVRFAITTNGTNDASKHYDVWRRYHMNVSVSIDGPKAIHDNLRLTRTGKGSYEDAVKYCNYLKSKNFPFSVVGVFDERHIGNGITYLETIKHLNKISPIVKVQFVEALGDAGANPAAHLFQPNDAKVQIKDAVDEVWSYITRKWVHPAQYEWLYDNNILRYAYGVVKEKAKPYQHACTASNLTTIMPSGSLMPCYTFSDKPELNFGTITTTSTELEDNRQKYRENHTWAALVSKGATAPWYRGIVGDVCVADMLNSDQPGYETSLFYKTFQSTAALRTVQHVASTAPGSIEHARVLRALEAHERITGMFSSSSYPKLI